MALAFSAAPTVPRAAFVALLVQAGQSLVGQAQTTAEQSARSVAGHPVGRPGTPPR